MIRLIIRTDDATTAAHVSGPVHVTYRTFDVDLPEVERFLAQYANQGLIERHLVGAELIAKATTPTA